MTNENDDEEFLREVQQFLKEKWNQNRPCERCDHYVWSVLSSSTAFLHIQARGALGPSSLYHTINSIEYLPVYCDNCGNTVMIYLGVFDEWRRRRKAATSSS